MVRIVGCIPKYYKNNEAKLSEIERIIADSNANILLLPEEYFGGPDSIGKLESFSTKSKLFFSLSEIANRYSCGMTVGLIEEKDSRKYQAMWFFDEKGVHLGTERKHNLARYELYNYGLEKAENYDRHVYSMKGTKGTCVFCWEVHDIRARVACDEVTPDWILDAIKFPPDCLTTYVEESPQKTIKELIKSKETYTEWLEKLKLLASDLITLVVATCGTHFSLCRPPKKARPIAAIIHPDSKVSSERFQFGPTGLICAEGTGKTRIDRGVLGTVAYTEIPGSFVCFDYHDDISLLRNGSKSYEARFGKGSYPMGMSVGVRSWQLRHIGKVQE